MYNGEVTLVEEVGNGGGGGAAALGRGVGGGEEGEGGGGPSMPAREARRSPSICWR